MIFSSLLSDSRLIFSSKLMIFCLENHDSFEIENFYHLLCAFSFYFSTSALRKSLSFTMCFLILFLDFLWKHAWIQLILTEKISIIYYVLSHRVHFISQRVSWEHLYYLLCAFSLNHVLRRAHYHWKNLYYLVNAFSVINVQDLTSILIEIDVKSFLETLRKSLLFSRCFFIIFFDECIEKK